MRLFFLLPALFVLAACSSAPGHFVRSEVDPVSHSLVYRFDPTQVDRAAMEADALSYCQHNGFDRAYAIPGLKSSPTGQARAAYLCVYQPVHAVTSDKR
ncbi:Uncharacterised protein [Edwardsiella tarda]|nr:Uncharacterised protein [Edwardsiella tarda]